MNERQSEMSWTIGEYKHKYLGEVGEIVHPKFFMQWLWFEELNQFRDFSPMGIVSDVLKLNVNWKMPKVEVRL